MNTFLSSRKNPLITIDNYYDSLVFPPSPPFPLSPLPPIPDETSIYTYTLLIPKKVW